MEDFSETFFGEKHSDVENVPYHIHVSKTGKVKQLL